MKTRKGEEREQGMGGKGEVLSIFLFLLATKSQLFSSIVKWDGPAKWFRNSLTQTQIMARVGSISVAIGSDASRRVLTVSGSPVPGTSRCVNTFTVR